MVSDTIILEPKGNMLSPIRIPRSVIRLITCFVLVVTSAAAGAGGDLVISELMAVNDTTMRNNIF